MKRLIKDPFYTDLNFIDLDVDDVNKNREANDLHAELSESELKFDELKYIKAYAKKIGATDPVLKEHKAELWYYADLKTVQYLKKHGLVWDWGYMDDMSYISNYDELVNLETEEDKACKAESLQDDINDQLWKYGGRLMGSGYEVSVIEVNGGLIKYFINTDLNIEVTPAYDASPEQLSILETIKNELL